MSVVLNDTHAINSHMRFYEITNIKPKNPLTPQQARINALKKNADIAKQALASERKAQQIQKAQSAIRKLTTQKIGV